MGMPSSSAASASALGVSQNHNNTWSRSESNWYNAAQAVGDATSWSHTSADKALNEFKNILNSLDNLSDGGKSSGGGAGRSKSGDKTGNGKERMDYYSNRIFGHNAQR